MDAVPPARREPLLAWLLGWRHHWPASFQRALGAEGARLAAALRRAGCDDGRVLKPRRIAIANLSGIL